MEIFAIARTETFSTRRDLFERGLRDRVAEFLVPTVRTALPTALHEELAAQSTPQDLPDLVALVSTFVRNRVNYVTGSTHMLTTATSRGSSAPASVRTCRTCPSRS